MNALTLISQVIKHECAVHRIDYKEDYTDRIVSALEINYDIIINKDTDVGTKLNQLVIDEINELMVDLLSKKELD